MALNSSFFRNLERMFNSLTNKSPSVLKTGVLRLLVLVMLLQGWILSVQAAVVCPHSLPKAALAQGTSSQGVNNIAAESSAPKMMCHHLSGKQKQTKNSVATDTSSQASQISDSTQSAKHSCCNGAGLCSHCVLHASAVLHDPFISIGVTSLSVEMETPFHLSFSQVDRALIDRPPIAA